MSSPGPGGRATPRSPSVSPKRRLLEDAHRIAARPLGQLALYLERASVPRTLALYWASELRRAADMLDEFSGERVDGGKGRQRE